MHIVGVLRGGGLNVGSTVRARDLIGPDEVIARPAQLQLRDQPVSAARRAPAQCDRLCERLGLDSVTSWNGFEDQLELAGRERVLRRLSPLHDTLTEAELVERQRAVVAIGIVASTAEEGIRSPCTAAVADFSIVARAAE